MTLPVVPCDDLDAALAFLTTQLGFRVDAVAPADDPTVAAVSGHGLQFTLQRAGSTALRLLGCHSPDLPALREELVVTSADAGAWVTGRAGMRYRDLIPGRLGGRFIASHIQIPQGGPVPDYVHFHNVRFQLIFCVRGWVEVVYEDQGPPFVLHAGDCVLQPPQIRHRVLDASPGLEVIEVASPAEHLTCADHEMALPTDHAAPERVFAGQRFVHHVAAEATWSAWTSPGWECRDTGVATATDGLASVRVVRPAGARESGVISHDGEFLQLVVLAGAVTLRAGELTQRLGPATSAVIPAGMAFALDDADAATELLEVAVPA